MINKQAPYFHAKFDNGSFDADVAGGKVTPDVLSADSSIVDITTEGYSAKTFGRSAANRSLVEYKMDDGNWPNTKAFGADFALYAALVDGWACNELILELYASLGLNFRLTAARGGNTITIDVDSGSVDNGTWSGATQQIFGSFDSAGEFENLQILVHFTKSTGVLGVRTSKDPENDLYTNTLTEGTLESITSLDLVCDQGSSTGAVWEEVRVYDYVPTDLNKAVTAIDDYHGETVMTPSEVLDLGDYTQLSNEGTQSVPVADKFAPGETRARQFDVTYSHSNRSPSAEVAGDTGKFSVTTRMKNHPSVGLSFSGVFLSQMQNNSGVFVGSFFCQWASGGIQVYCVDTETNSVVNRLLTATNDITSLLTLDEDFEIGIRANAKNGPLQEIVVLINGVDVAETVGYATDSVVGGTGVIDFDADAEITKTTLGNYDHDSGTQNGLVGIQGRTRWFNGQVLTDEVFLAEYTAQEAMVVEVAEDEVAEPTGMPSVKHSDGDIVDIIPDEDIPAGAVVIMGTRIAVAFHEIKAGELGHLKKKCNARFSKEPGLLINLLDAVFWDETERRITKTASGNTFAGVAMQTSPEADPQVVVGVR